MGKRTGSKRIAPKRTIAKSQPSQASNVPSAIPNPPINIKLVDELLATRLGGVYNLIGVRYQLLYGLLRAFDTYSADGLTSVRFEGLEDLDLALIDAGDIHVQIKTSTGVQGWDWIKDKKVLDHFIEVYRSDPTRRFHLVTNFPFTKPLSKLVSYSKGQLTTLPDETTVHLRQITARCGLNEDNIPEFLRAITYEQISEQEILGRLVPRLLQTFDLTAGNEALFITHLVSRTLDWSIHRANIGRRELDTEKLQVLDWVALGPENPVVRDRIIVPLALRFEPNVDDYYEGKQARIGHILAGLDAPRPHWQRDMERKVSKATTCVIRASSGQGKSTLMLRYAIEHYVPNATFQLRICENEQQVGQLADYIRSRLTLGLPLLVVLDNLGYSTRLWFRVATELAGENVKFMVTTREEDWYRYGSGESGYIVSFVSPDLSRDEARNLFSYFRQHNRIDPSVHSADWAYEQVANRRLLIEFVYLITHGQMLADRIHEQVKVLATEPNGAAKLGVLRLVATAQVSDSRVPIDGLVPVIKGFGQDADAVLSALNHEYIECFDNLCEGLHYVRSDHLVRALHATVPIRNTLLRLLQVLDEPNLLTFIATVFARHPEDADEMTNELIQRYEGASIASINRVVEALLRASEELYFLMHKHVFDSLIGKAGNSASQILAVATLPLTPPDIEDGLPFLKIFLPQFKSREHVNAYEVPRAFLEKVLGAANVDEHQPLSESARLVRWCAFFSVPANKVDDYLHSDAWHPVLMSENFESTSAFLNALFHRDPNTYHGFLDANKDWLQQRYCLLCDVVAVSENDGEVEIEFIVDPAPEATSINQQAVTRLEQLRLWFPIYKVYNSKGLYPTGEVLLEHHPATKHIPAQTLDLGLNYSINSTYLSVVQLHYAQQSTTEWLGHWHHLRERALGFAQSAIRVYEAMYRDGRFTFPPITSDDTLSVLSQKLFEMPARLKQQFEHLQDALRSWETSIYNVSWQFTQHNSNNAANETTIRMRKNLHDAISTLRSMHHAFTAILDAEGDLYGSATLNNSELIVYPYLQELIDYWFEGPHARENNLTSKVRRWRNELNSQFEGNIRRCLEPLAASGMRFAYPVAPLRIPSIWDERVLTASYVGYEVRDFTRQAEQRDIILAELARCRVDHDLLYLVPLVQGHLMDDWVFFQSETAAAGYMFQKRERAGMATLPAPDDLQIALPNVEHGLLPDISVLRSLERLVANLVAERNSLYLSQLMLSNNGEQRTLLLQQRKDHLADSVQALQRKFAELQQEASNLEQVAIVVDEWTRLWAEASKLISELSDLKSAAEQDGLATTEGPPALRLLVNAYLNRKYGY